MMPPVRWVERDVIFNGDVVTAREKVLQYFHQWEMGDDITQNVHGWATSGEWRDVPMEKEE